MSIKPLACPAHPVLSAVALVVALVGAATRVLADDGQTAAAPPANTCSVASLHGTYGFTFQGVNLNPDGTHALEFAGVGVETFDGGGTITNGRLIAVFGGQPSTPSFSGTYSVNADCTGTKTITINGQASHYALVLVDGAREIETAETDPGTLLVLRQVRQ